MINKIKAILVLLFISTLVGCSGSSKSPVVKTTDQFRVSVINVDVKQFHTPELEYHSLEELKALVETLVLNKLEDENLLSDSPEMDEIEINIGYIRRFVGDETPIPSDSLAYPTFNYDVKLSSSSNSTSTSLIEKKNLVYNGGIAMNMQTMVGGLRDKSYEIKFAQAVANSIAKDIRKLSK